MTRCSHRSLLVQLIPIALLNLGLIGCAGAPVTPKSQDVTVAAVGPGALRGGQLKRQQLESEVMRYGDRFMARMALEADRILERSNTQRTRYFAAGWKLQCRTAVIEIAIGPNAVENLLDMLVLATLTRHSVETYWAPEFLGGDLGTDLLKASRQLEEEAWSGSGVVLTSEQQDQLRAVIQEWITNNPGQRYIWGVRFGGFSGQRAEELARLEETGGLLAEAQRARETVDEVRAFSERVLYYMLRAPTLTRNEAVFGMQEVFRMPEVVRLLNNVDRVTQSTERYAALADKFPAEREAAIKQLMTELSREREAAIIQASQELSREREAAIKQAMQEQQQAIRALLTSDEFIGTLAQIRREGGEIADVTFMRGALLILLWVIAYVLGKLLSDYLTARLRLRRAHGA